MCSKATTTRTEAVGKVLAIIVGSFGLYLIGGSLMPLWHMIQRDDSFSVYFVVFTTLMAILGGYCIYCAVRAWWNISASIVRGICLITAIFVCSVPIGILEKLNKSQGFAWTQIMLPLTVIAGGIFYWLCSKWLIRQLALPEAINFSRREKMVKHFFGFLAVLLLGAFYNVIMVLTSKNQGDISAFAVRWLGIAMFGLLLLALVFYKVAVRIVLRKDRIATNDKMA